MTEKKWHKMEFTFWLYCDKPPDIPRKNLEDALRCLFKSTPGVIDLDGLSVSIKEEKL